MMSHLPQRWGEGGLTPNPRGYAIGAAWCSYLIS